MNEEPAEPSTTPLTERQRKVLEFIVRFQEEKGCPPTFREIGKQLRIASTNGVNRHLDALVRKGYLRKARTFRGIEVLEEHRPSRGLPVLGRIAAGRPIEAVENFEGTLNVQELFGRPPEVFALRVAGDSMMKAGIRDGDMVVIRRQPRVENGQVGAALVGGEATVKRIYVERDRIRLVPENDAFTPQEYGADDPTVRVLGKVVGLVRKL
ncbi:MAG: transcriptional repressor LexA [Planctomycetes bacterium]|nr:transcriptional repressor LexA [Planctomycetota bacterium]